MVVAALVALAAGQEDGEGDRFWVSDSSGIAEICWGRDGGAVDRVVVSSSNTPVLFVRSDDNLFYVTTGEPSLIYKANADGGSPNVLYTHDVVSG